jgi:hypothetical protein
LLGPAPKAIVAVSRTVAKNVHIFMDFLQQRLFWVAIPSSLLQSMRRATGLQLTIFKERDRFELCTGFAINLYCPGKIAGVQFSRRVKADLAMLIADYLSIIEIVTRGAALEHSGFV